MIAKLGVPSASAVKDKITAGPGLARKGEVWFVAASGGAVWVTNIDATGPDESGTVLPLTDQARAQSESGVDVPPGAPAFAGLTDSSPGAVAAKKCAGG